ncbi:MAG: tetratricopeptide repeat protein [Pseudomonadota bacterium]
MLTRTLRSTMLAMTLVLATPAFAADPTLHEVYTAAEAGKLNEAQAMMDIVLRAHPNSAKAHFVEAELLAKQNRFADAKVELLTAERLQPDMKFATPSAVRNLHALIDNSAQRARAERTYQPAAPVRYVQPAPQSSGMPWGLIFLAGGLVVLVIWVSRRRAAQAQMAQGGMPTYMGGGNQMPSYGPGGQMMGQAGSGIGSGIMGGLATGAAVGAGIVAGEALMHHFTDNNNQNSNYVPPAQGYVPEPSPQVPNDMGGNDFGVSDSGSWDSDSGGGGGGDDWN